MTDFSQPLPSVVDRDDQVLRCLAEWRESGLLGLPEDAEVAERTGLALEDVQAAARSLADEGLVQVHRGGLGRRYMFERLGPGVNARTGLWPRPEEAADRLLAALDDVVRNGTPEEQTRAQKIRDLVTGGGVDLVTNVATALVGRAMGLG